MTIIVITLVLFVAALFAKGITHDMLLEGAVFLVSVKLVIMSYKNVIAVDWVNKRLDDIYEAVSSISPRTL
ncbi:MAG: hypothetical protein ACC682_11665 [Gemmatimonadota bacterium]